MSFANIYVGQTSSQSVSQPVSESVSESFASSHCLCVNLWFRCCGDHGYSVSVFDGLILTVQMVCCNPIGLWYLW